MSRRITILGGGNGAFAAAGHLTMDGHAVTLYECPEFAASVAEVRKTGGIELKTLPSNHIPEGFARLAGVTTDIKEALADAEIVLVIVPSFAHAEMARLAAPFLRPDQLIVLAPGNLFGPIEFARVVRACGNTADLTYADLDCMMYACRKTGPASVWLRGYKHALGCAAFPAERNDEVFARLSEVYPYLVKKDNILATGMSNPNFAIHIPIMLFNIANVDHKRDMLFYADCMTESVGMFIDAIDRERMAFDRAGIFGLVDLAEQDRRWYGYQGVHGDTIYELGATSPLYPNSKMPTEKLHRYFTEDVPYGLIPALSLLKKFGFPHTAVETAANAACILCGRDFFAEARTLERLGLGDLSGEALLDLVRFGFQRGA
jgi:opine dehydrogenase